MTTAETIGWLTLALPVVAGLAATVAVVLLKEWAPAREAAIAGADYVEAIKAAVELAERYGVSNRLPGFEKAAIAVREMDAWLDQNGIHGDVRRVTRKRVVADIELMRARLFPKTPIIGA